MNFQKLVKSVLLAGILCFGLIASSYAADVTLNLSTNKIDNTIAAGNTFQLKIGVSESATLCGAALSVEYDPTILEPVTAAGVLLPAGEIDANDADIKSDIFDIVIPSGSTTGEYTRVGNVIPTGTPGIVRLSGANIGTNGAGEFTGAKNLFTLFFKVKSTTTNGDYATAFKLVTTKLYNPAAGWGTTTDTTPVEVPPLVGVPDNWATLTDVSQQFVNITATNLPLTFPIKVGEEVAVVKGDMNGDSLTTLADVVLVLKAYKTGIATDEQKIAGDMNGDSQITLADVVLILRKYKTGQ